MDKVWEYHNSQMEKLKQIYQRINKQTQNKLQMILKTYNFNQTNLYQIADSKTKNSIDIYIEELKDKGLLIGYFGNLAKNVYSRTRVKNSEILELLIYGTYIEEQSKLDQYEQQIMYDDANYYYQKGQEEVNKKKKPSILEIALFLYFLEQPNTSGFNWKQYAEIIVQNNVQQLYRQVLINIQQQKELGIENNEFQRLFNQQQNTKLCINGNIISGSIDNIMVGLNNLAKVEGIKEQDRNAKVKFVAIIDGKETDMCHSLDGQEFYIDKENVFDRYYGEIQSELKIERIKCKGLVLGLNLPPISHHFHWCRSYIVYLPVEKNNKKEYNLDIPKISEEVKQILKDTKVNSRARKLFNRYLTKENTKIDNSLDVPMRYSIEKDKILINPNHKDFKYYNLQKSLTHEIVHMIDVRENIKIKDLLGNVRRSRLDILANEEKYKNIFNDEKFANNMELSDIFSAITENQVMGNYGHDNKYWSDSSNIERELKANIITAYLTKNNDFMNTIKDITSLYNLKDEVIKAYVKRIS